MSSFLVEYLGHKLTREPHPLPRPLAPLDKKAKDYPEKLATYEAEQAEYDRIDAGLARFVITQLVCDSGMVVQARYLNFEPYLGKRYSAELLTDSDIQIVPTKKGK